jgi:hypothetical protein
VTQWHLINNDGDIVRTCTASSRADAVALLGRGGTVVSALSWKHDVHRWRAVKTVVTDMVQTQKKKPYENFVEIKDGYLRVMEIAKRFDTREGKVRRIIDKHNIPCEVVQHKGRKIQTYSPRSVERIKKYLAKEPEHLVPRAIVMKRRNTFLEKMRTYYQQGIHSREARRKAQ